MIRKLLRDMSVDFFKNEESMRNISKYRRLNTEPGWTMHQALLINILNKISEYMLSEKFMRLSIEERDAQYRGFYHTKEIIDFLLDPLKGANYRADIQRHNKEVTEGKRPKRR